MSLAEAKTGTGDQRSRGIRKPLAPRDHILLPEPIPFPATHQTLVDLVLPDGPLNHTVVNGNHQEEPRYPTTRAEWATFPVETRRGRLYIGGWEVMGRWERPVEERTIRELNNRISGVHRPTILIGGEGMGFSTLTELAEARDRGGAEIHVIELHPQVLGEGYERAEQFLRRMSPEQRARISLHFHLGDLRDILPNFPDDMVSAARMDPYPLEEGEREIDGWVHMDQLVRIGTHSLVAAPYVGHEDRPLPEQLAYVEGRFLNEDRMWVSVAPPRDCTYFQGQRMVISIFRTPNKPLRSEEEKMEQLLRWHTYLAENQDKIFSLPRAA